MRFKKLFSVAGFAFLIPVAGALMLLNYSMFDQFLRSIGKEILFTGIRVAISGSPNPNSFNVTALKANIAASEFVRPLRPSKTYLYSIRPNEVLIQRVGLLRYHFVLTAPDDSRKLLVFEIFSEKILWFFHGSTAFMWLLLLSFSWALRKRARKESLIKENVMKEALEAWLRQGELSSFVSDRFPQLVQWWERRQAEVDEQTRALHDIKVPLAALESGASSTIQQNVRAIQSIIDGKKAKTETQDFDINEALRAAAASASAVSTRAKVSIRAPLVRAPRMLGVGEDFHRHLTNLLVNAIEASCDPLGVATVLVEMRAEEDARGLRIAVKDWGKGIPSHALARIGKKGFTFGKAKGSGFGLHYCRKWIQEHGGDLSIESKEGRGTTVTLHFPWEMISFDAGKTFRSILNDKAKLVVLDDDALFRDIYGMVFRSLGIREDRILRAESERELDEVLRKIGKEEFWILSDYYFDDSQMKGPDFLRAREIAHRGVLISNVDMREDLRESLNRIGMPFWSKESMAELLSLGRQDDQPEQRVPADHHEQHPTGAV